MKVECLFLFLVEFKRKEHFNAYKIPGGKRISLGDEESIYAFDSYYPEWAKQLYMVPPYLSKRDNLFGEDKGYTGETEIAHSFLESKINGILISNFSSKDKNKILQSKSKETFEIDFIFLAENFEMWIIEVRKSQPSRIAKSIKEKFEQTINNRNLILRLATKMFGTQFSDTLGNICNCVVAIPDAKSDDFKKFKSTEIWGKFKSESPCYKVEFINDKCSVTECIPNGKQICLDDFDLMKLKRFYAALTLVKTSILSFDPEQYLSAREKRDIAEFTHGMHPSEYHIILSPEQWSLLEELPTHVQIVGEAATGKTELLKAMLFKILKYLSMNKEMHDCESKISKISEGLEQILFIIFGERPYLKDNMEKFISQVRNKLSLSKNHKPVVELHMISDQSAEDIDTHLSQLLESKRIRPKDNFILIDECYHRISMDFLLNIFYNCRGCWMAGVLTGQNPLTVGWIPDTYLARFQVRPLRRLYRGTKGITTASSTLRLASTSDIPSFLANQVSYIESFNDLKVKDIDQFPGLQDAKDTLAVFLKGDRYSGSLNFLSRCDSIIIEEIHLNDEGMAKNCLYLSKCAGFERNSVTIIVAVSLQQLFEKADIMYKLLSIYTSRAVNTCTIYCRREAQAMLLNKLFPKKTVQVLRFRKDSELPMFSDQEIISDLESINSNLSPLAVASGADNMNVQLFAKLMQDQPPTVLRDTFENIMLNSVQPNMEIVRALLASMNDINMRTARGKTPLIIAAEQKQTKIIRHLMLYDKDIKAYNLNKDTTMKESTGIMLDLVKDHINVNARDHDGVTALIHAAHYGHMEVVRYLIEASPNVNGQDKDAITALNLAALNGHMEIVKYLIEANVSVNGQVKDSHIALILAADNGHMEIVKYLIEANADINGQGKNGHTALISAAYRGHLEIVKFFIKADANVDEHTSNGFTALIAAAQNGHMETVKFLIEANANVNDQTHDGSTALSFAAHYGHMEIVKYLIEVNANVNRQEKNGVTALRRAAQNGHMDIVKYLIEAGANVNEQDDNGDTALLSAAQNGHVEVVKCLIEANASVDGQGGGGLTALILAAQNGHVEIVKCLIEANANVSEQDNNGVTALSLAAQNGHLEVVKYLIEVNANVNGQDKYGVTALILAAENGHMEVVKYLIGANAKVNEQDYYGYAALILAAENGHMEIVTYLIQANANINEQEEDGSTALHFAVRNGHVEIVKYLIKAGAEINLQNSHGSTALNIAAEFGSTQIVDDLINANADVNLQDADGDTPLTVSAACGHMEIVKSLIKAGSDVNLGNNNEDTAIILAARWGKTNFVQESLKAYTTRFKTTHEMMKHKLIKANIKAPNRYSQIVEDLIEAKADVNLHNKDGYTSIIFAAQDGNIDIVQCLIKSNANVNAPNKNGDTPLIVAAFNGHTNIVKTLIEADANIDVQNKDGDTALIIAAHSGNDEIMSELSKKII